MATVRLQPVSAAAAAAILAGDPLPDVEVADGFPSEFSRGIAEQAQSAGVSPTLGPFFIHRADDDAVVGEIGAAIGEPAVAEIGYAVVEPCWGRGYATAAVAALLDVLRSDPAVERVIAHTPPDRPASGRVLEKAGFALDGEVEDEHEGQVIRVWRWSLRL